jgi:hypothetical protein
MFDEIQGRIVRVGRSNLGQDAVIQNIIIILQILVRNHLYLKHRLFYMKGEKWIKVGS